MRCLFIFVAFALAAPASWAQFSGVVSGRVTATDSREDPYSAAGYLSSTNPLGNAEYRLPNRFNDRLVNVPEILVEVCVELGFVPCRYQWTRTDEGGRFAVPWSGLLPPTKIRARVYAMRPQLADGEVIAGSNPPPREFRVTTAGVTNAIVGSNEINSSTGGLEGNQTLNVRLSTTSTAVEVVSAYLTAEETYAMLSEQSIPAGGSIRSDMQGVDIFANSVFSGDSGGGVAPTNAEVLLVPGVAQARPFTLAHELGHIVAWRAMDWLAPPYEFSAYTYDGDVTWSDFSNEHEKPAFWEGFAHFVGGMWMWPRDANPGEPTGNTCGASGNNPGFPRGHPLTAVCVSLETASQHSATGLIGCGSGVSGHRRATCVARSFWDIVDRPPGTTNDAMTNRDLGHVVRVLRSYPRLCFPAPFDNRCRDEFGYDGNNWKDYQANHLSIFTGDAAALDAIESSNDQQGATND